jgi:hypothetical protein
MPPSHGTRRRQSFLDDTPDGYRPRKALINSTNLSAGLSLRHIVTATTRPTTLMTARAWTTGLHVATVPASVPTRTTRVNRALRVARSAGRRSHVTDDSHDSFRYARQVLRTMACGEPTLSRPDECDPLARPKSRKIRAGFRG